MSKLDSLIKAQLPKDSKYWKRGGEEYSGPAPYRTGSDSAALHVTFGAKNRWYDHVDKKGGGFGSLAKLLGIQVGTYEPSQLPVPKSLAEYEENRNLPKGYLAARGWSEGTHDKRPCIFIPTAGLTTKNERLRQVRYLDHQHPKYMWEYGVMKDANGKANNPIYGLKEAIEIADRDGHNFLIHCNGAISVEVAQFWGIPAFAVLGGEQNIDSRHTNVILKQTDLSLVIALDCDKAGKDAADTLLQLYGERAIAIDLKGTKGFDLDDFCRLWEHLALPELITMAERAVKFKPARTMQEAGDVVIAQLKGDLPLTGRLIPFPFTRLHEFEGGLEVMMPGLMTGVLGITSGGKTAFWQSLAELLLRQTRKWGIMVDAREFKPEDDFFRHLMRETNPRVSHSDITRHLMYQQMAQEGHYIADEEREFARLMSADQLEGVFAHHANLKYRYSGYMEYAQEFFYVEDTLDYMLRRTKELRYAGHYMDLWIIDYLTVLKCKPESMQGAGENIYNIILDLIKTKAREANVHVLVLLQPNKEPSTDLKERNRLLTINDMAYASGNYFNTILSLNPLYGAKSEWAKADNAKSGAWAVVRDPATGNVVRDRALLKNGTIACMIKILKNTNGKPDGVKKMVGDFERVRWLDEGWNSADLRVPLDAK